MFDFELVPWFGCLGCNLAIRKLKQKVPKAIKHNLIEKEIKNNKIIFITLLQLIVHFLYLPIIVTQWLVLFLQSVVLLVEFSLFNQQLLYFFVIVL